MFCALEWNFSDFLPLQVGQQIPRVGSGGFGSVQFKVGHVGGRQVTTPRCKKYYSTIAILLKLLTWREENCDGNCAQ